MIVFIHRYRALPLIFIVSYVLLAAGCSDVAGPPKFTSPPKLVDNISGAVALSAVVEFESNQAVVATYTVTDSKQMWDAHSRDVSLLVKSKQADYEGEQADYKVAHRDALLKFRPQTQHQIRVRITNREGQATEFSKSLSFNTGALPETFPEIEDTQGRDIGDDSNAIRLLSVSSKTVSDNKFDGNQSLAVGWLIGLDPLGAVVWYLPTDYHWHAIEPLESGNLRLYSDLGHSIEIDMLGKKIRGWAAQSDRLGSQYLQKHSLPLFPLQVDGIHHRSDTSVGDNSLALSYEIEYRTGQVDGRQRAFFGDVVSELDSLGNIVQQWRMGDLLDPERGGFETFDSLGVDFYGRAGHTESQAQSMQRQTIDWSSASGLAYDNKTDTIIVALRNQRALVGFGRASGKLKWLVAEPAGWGQGHADKVLYPDSSSRGLDGGWPLSFGKPHVTPDGHIIVLDRQLPGDVSRVMRYRINEKDLTFTQTISHELAIDLRPSRMLYAKNQDRLVVLADGGEVQPTAALFTLPYSAAANNQSVNKAHFDSALRLKNARILDAIVVPQIIPPALSTDSRVVADPSLEKIDSDEGPPATAAEPAAVDPTLDQTPVTEGDWTIIMGPPGSKQLQQTLKIDQQRGPVAIGYLDEYPVMVRIKNRSLRFTYRTTGYRGTAQFRFDGVISASGLEVAGLLRIRDSDGQILESDIPWHGTRQ